MSAVHSNLSELDQLLQDLNSAQFMAEVDRRNTGTYQGLPSITEKATATQHQMVNGTGQRVVSAPSPMSPTPVVPKPARMEGRVAVDTLLDELESAVPHSQSHHTYAGVYSQPQSIHTQHQVATSQTYQPQSHVSQSYASQNVYSSQPLYQELPAQPIRATSAATKELDDLMASLSEFKMTNVHEQVSTAADSPYSLPNKNRMQAGVEGGAASAQGDQLDSMLGSLQSDMNRQGVSTKTKGSCAACSKPVVGQVITALGKVWHVEHFVCAHCNEQLGTRSFYERDGRAFCERDYHTLFAPKCAYCNGPIVDKCVTALDKTWHPDHFFCAQCGRNFGEEGFHERDGNAYCRDDYLKLFAPKCGGCGRPIKDNYISALNRHWHPECFVCWDCHMPFGSMSFFDHDGLPYCEMHYHAKRGSLCAYCQKPITGRCITAMYKKFHPEHFVCAFCLKQLNKGTFKEQNDKPYCHPCFVKLFG